MRLPPETVIGERYQLKRQLGEGSFAATYLAHDRHSEGLVAVKVLDSTRITDLKSLELFEREAKVLGSLRHHAIPEVIELVHAEIGGKSAPCLVMEYVEGESLAALLAQGRHLDRPMVMRLFLELIGVLDYLHTRLPPILHRDLKPANIIVRPDGTPALVDFGSVRANYRPGDGSTVAGTYGYMAYEQYMGHASPSSDLYGLAATTLHLVTGTPPAGFMTENGRIEVPPDLPCGEPLRSVLTRLLRPAPNERFQTAAEVRDVLLGAAAEPSAPAKALVPVRRTVDLPAGPRRMDGATRELYRKIAPGTWRLLNAEQKSAGVDVGSVVLVGFFSVLTAGILPLWFWSLSGSRRRRVRPFVEAGVVTTATILDMNTEDVGFQVKLMRVRYQFTVGSETVRASDQVLPSVAERWVPGDAIEVLYLPGSDNDSVIASTS